MARADKRADNDCCTIATICLRRDLMELVARQAGSRRKDSPVEFPLTDFQGLLVEKDRRQHPDRRRTGYAHALLPTAPYKKRGRVRNRLIFLSMIVAANAAFILLAYALVVAIQD